MKNYSILGLSIAAIVIAIIGLVITMTPDGMVFGETGYEPQIREIYLFSKVNEHINEDKLGIPPDMYSVKTIVVNQGDTVKIHFYNLEPVESNEIHNFTIEGTSYDINENVNAGDHKIIQFTASKSGVFDYICKEHPPTMRGELVILPTNSQ
jgi:plastocyanin